MGNVVSSAVRRDLSGVHYGLFIARDTPPQKMHNGTFHVRLGITLLFWCRQAIMHISIAYWTLGTPLRHLGKGGGSGEDTQSLRPRPKQFRVGNALAPPCDSDGGAIARGSRRLGPPLAWQRRHERRRNTTPRQAEWPRPR